jgi:hypothetical protein
MMQKKREARVAPYRALVQRITEELDSNQRAKFLESLEKGGRDQLHSTAAKE